MLALALAFSSAACLSAQIGTDGGAGGVTGGSGGDGTGVGGGAETGGMGAGGTGEGGDGPDAGTGGAGIDASGTGGAPVDAGAGGSPVDGGYDGPTGLTPNAAGQLVITEIMADTNDVQDESGEWFEVYNPSTTDTYDLYGCGLFDKSNSDVVASHVIVAPESFITLARFGTVAGGFVPTYDYHTTLVMGGTTLDPNQDVKFGNTGDMASITCGLVQIDVVDFRLWVGTNAMVPNGRSYSLDPSHFSATDNNVEGNWCTGVSNYHMTDRGSPGQTNPSCTCMNGTAVPPCI